VKTPPSPWTTNEELVEDNHDLGRLVSPSLALNMDYLIDMTSSSLTL
jgi:hypothetical protein